MQYFLTVVFFLICSNSFSQKIEDQIKAINTIEEATSFIESNENVMAEVWTIVPKIDKANLIEYFRIK